VLLRLIQSGSLLLTMCVPLWAAAQSGCFGGSLQHSRELAMEISLTSLGSSHTLRSPHFSTELASLFCSFRDTILPFLTRPLLPEEEEKRARTAFARALRLHGHTAYI
jgi:hypothetical protein